MRVSKFNPLLTMRVSKFNPLLTMRARRVETMEE